ncbi:MAG TPA: hypothetical protein VLW88_06130, partial [Hyphomicrobium sp.]|nr:hypothetical protein [Hyphomicrobium sp.]
MFRMQKVSLRRSSFDPPFHEPEANDRRLGAEISSRLEFDSRRLWGGRNGFSAATQGHSMEMHQVRYFLALSRTLNFTR